MQDFEVNLICVEDGIDSSKDSGKLMIYVLSVVTEIEGLEKQHRQLTGAKGRLGQQMDSLDIMDKFYEKKYQGRLWLQQSSWPPRAFLPR